MKAAYIQSIGGASGDMLLGALIDLGLSVEALQEGLSLLSINGYELSAAQEHRCEIRGTKLSVTLSEDIKHSPRALSGVVASSDLPKPVKDNALRILRNLWRAEARVHGEESGDLELEELGTVDTLVDIAGFAWGLHHLGIDQVYSAPLVLGASSPPRWPGGYSNPAPATLELVAAAAAPISPELPMHQGAGELTTPTGAAIITSLARFERPAMTVEGVGVGLGGKNPEAFPNVVRIWLGSTEPAELPGKSVAPKQGNIVLLETNLDDATGEILGYAQERLFDLGALDVWHTPIQMKKNRPGVLLSVLLPRELENDCVELLLRETPTLGIRSRAVERYAAERRTETLETEWGKVRVKIKYLAGEPVAASPEYEDCRQIAMNKGVPFQALYKEVEGSARLRYLTK
ncbi:MAG: nickel pincer cofactor biosynthesis protein LarC [Chloroflexi bacterium]|nr:nickel pincer cofactor biosynthesis protein LarC [Chloroflexota bacterium]